MHDPATMSLYRLLGTGPKAISGAGIMMGLFMLVCS